MPAVLQDTRLVVVSCDKVEGMVGVVVDEVRGSKEGQEYMVEYLDRIEFEDC